VPREESGELALIDFSRKVRRSSSPMSTLQGGGRRQGFGTACAIEGAPRQRHGLHLLRHCSFRGRRAADAGHPPDVAYELLEHQLKPEQIRIYDAYVGAFAIIHNNIDAAMRAANITGETRTLNAQAKSAARSAFESTRQRFFGHLLTSMKTPSLIRSIEQDLVAGHAAVIQIVSTGEALTERCLATSLSPAASGKMSKHSIRSGDIAGLFARFARLREKRGSEPAEIFRSSQSKRPGLTVSGAPEGAHREPCRRSGFNRGVSSESSGEDRQD